MKKLLFLLLLATPALAQQQAVSIRDQATPAYYATVDADGNLQVEGRSNASSNLAQVGGTAVDTNTGNASAGSQRVVLATDQPAVAVKVQDGSGTAITSTGNALDINVASGVTVDVAEGTAAGSYPALIGLRADSTENASVGDGAAVRAASDLKGRQVVNLWAVPEMWVHGNAVQTTTTGAELIAADASYKICVTGASVYNLDAANSAVLQILDNGDIGVGTLMFYIAAPANGGETKTINPPICTSAVSQSVDVDAATGATSAYVSLWGYKTAE